MFARRRLVQPEVIPSVEGAPRRRNDRESTGSRMAGRRAPQITSRPKGAKADAWPRSSIPPRADARRTTLDEADAHLRQTVRMRQGDRGVPAERPNAPEPQNESRELEEAGQQDDLRLSL